jgi:DNA-binding transcriptional ArsR family regulator
MDATSNLLKILSHPLRRRIIKCLAEQGSLSFNDLLKLINSRNHGELGFHLRAMKDLIEKKSSGEYSLTNKGLLAANLLDNISLILSGATQDLSYSPIRYAQRLVLGEHAFLSSDSETTKKDIYFPYLKAGLENGEAAVFFGRRTETRFICP